MLCGYAEEARQFQRHIIADDLLLTAFIAAEQRIRDPRFLSDGFVVGIRLAFEIHNAVPDAPRQKFIFAHIPRLLNELYKHSRAITVENARSRSGHSSL